MIFAPIIAASYAFQLKVCPLCDREIPPELESKHHLVPKLKGGKTVEENLVILHRPCHDKVHAVFTEAELARHYATVDDLLGHPEVAKFATWIAKRPIEFRDGTTSLRKRRQQRGRSGRMIAMSVEGLEAESDSVGPGIYGGRVKRDTATGYIIIGKQFEEHNSLPGPVYAGGGYTELSAAIRSGELHAVQKLLLDQPELAFEVSTGGATPLHVCSMSQRGQEAMAVVIEARQRGGSAAADATRTTEPVAPTAFTATRTRGSDEVDATDTWGYTALQRCATNNLALGAQVLMDGGASHTRPSGLEGTGDSARALALRLRSFAVLRVFQQHELRAGLPLPDGEIEL